jgi:SOS-response transcriptional repressor LexA
MNKDLTQKQLKVLATIKTFINKKGFSPTFEELRELLAKKG